jgi:hypothetical protein
MVAQLDTVRIGIDDASHQVYIELGGSAHLVPWNVAKEIALTLLGKASEAEQIAKVHQIVDDQAILHAAGTNIGLTDNPKIKKEVIKEAQWGIGRKVPKNPGMSVPSAEAYGTPKIIPHPRKV